MRGLLRCSSTLALSLALSPALLGGCGDDDVPAVPTDAGPRDAQVRMDSGGADGGEPTEDGGSDVDGAVDAGDAGSSGIVCSFDPEADLFTLATDETPRVRDVGVAAGDTGLALAWSARVEGLEQIFLGEIPATSGSASAQQITTAAAVHRDPVIAAQGDDWILSWYGNPDGDFDVYAVAFVDGRASGTPERLTTRAGRDDEPALLASGAGALAAWVETRAGDQRVAVARPLSSTAAPTAAQRDASTAATVSSPALGAREGGALMAWVGGGGADPRVLLQSLDASGSPVGAVRTVESASPASGGVDLATSADEGGVVVYGVTVGGARSEVRIRELASSGETVGIERVVTVAPEQGRDASVAQIGGGYVVAYRALEGSSAQVRLAFLGPDLERVGMLDLGGTTSQGGQVSVRASAEGRMVVGWAELGASSTTIRGARVRCE